MHVSSQGGVGAQPVGPNPFPDNPSGHSHLTAFCPRSGAAK